MSYSTRESPCRSTGEPTYLLGDIAYPDGTDEDFADCFDPTWGRHKQRMHPAAGNHEYHDDDAEGYFNYFGAAAGDPDKGYYSFDIGSWHIVVLNSNCDEVGGCDPGDPQVNWLEADLAANPSDCTLAVTHHARFSSGVKHGCARRRPAPQRMTSVASSGVPMNSVSPVTGSMSLSN